MQAAIFRDGDVMLDRRKAAGTYTPIDRRIDSELNNFGLLCFGGCFGSQDTDALLLEHYPWRRKHIPVPTSMGAMGYCVDNEGKVIIVGGYSDSSESVSNHIVSFEVGSNQFQEYDPLPQPMCYASITPYGGNNRILVTGGGASPFQFATYYDDTFLLNLAAHNTPQYITPISKLSTKRGGHVAVTTGNGTAIVVGGYDGRNYLKSVEIFDPQSGTWYEGPDMRKSRSGPGVVLGDDGAIYAAGKL
jgi:hypothetical protein